MKITYDKSVDAVYLDLRDESEKKVSWVKKTYSCDTSEIKGMINLDFDDAGRLGGIEVLDASKKLSKSILDNAEVIG